MRNRKGMTLIEVVVAMAIFGIIMVTIFPAFLITNLMNMTSKEFTDANYFAQEEIEEIFNFSRSNSLTETLIWLATDRDFDSSCGLTVLDEGTCTKEVDGFDFVLTYSRNEPTSGLTTIKIVVGTTTGQVSGDRAQIESYIRFDDGGV